MPSSQSSYEHIVQSLPVRVCFEGWESDTLRLQSHGWELAINQDLMRRQLGLVISHPKLRMYGISRAVGFDPYLILSNPKSQYGQFKDLFFQMIAISSDLRMLIPEPFSVSAAESFDARPQMVTRNEKNLSEFKLFRPLGGKEIWLEEHTAAQLMEEVLKKQKPKQAELREKAYKKERREWLDANQGSSEMVEPSFERTAQILTLAG